MKGNWLLFTILFLTSFDMHAQVPLLSPYLHLLGAPAAMIGLVIGAYSISNLTGNLLAGPLLDSYSKKWFIGTGLLLSGLILAGQGLVLEPSSFFGLRLVLGFLMAFVTPACFALLGESGGSVETQGKLMAKNGIVLTAASIVSPSIGALIAMKMGYDDAFIIFGAIMLMAGLLAFSMLPNSNKKGDNASRHRLVPLPKIAKNQLIHPALLGGFAVLYAQGTLIFEIPLLIQRQELSPSVTGTLFSVMAVGSLAVLCQFWLQRIVPHIRIYVGLVCLSLLMYVVAVGIPFSLYITMFLLGACFGLLFPAMTTVLTLYTPRELYGSVFSLFSAVLSLGAMIGPIIAGLIEELHHTFFIAFLVVMVSSLLGVLHNLLMSRTTT